jgi:hypothetical protein
MPLFTDAFLTLLETKGENTFAAERPCIIDRISLAITSTVDIYTLPSYVIDIKRITYKGWKVFPMPHRDLRASYLSGKQGGRPYWYVFNNIGQSQLKLFPVPQENITADNTYTNLWGAGILTDFIIEFYRLPDSTDSAARYNIPNFIRRRLLKSYVMSRAFQAEGRGTNVKATKYWRSKYDFLKSLYTELLDDLNNKPRNIIANNMQSRPYGFVPPPPMIPISKASPSHGNLQWNGISVDDITG